MLILSLPPVHQEELLRFIIEHPAVDAVRYNTGMSSARDPYGTLKLIKQLADKISKPVYVDLKAKQLRVTQWADVPYGPIELNHKIEVDLPARVYFRNDDSANLRQVVNGNEIYVDPLPRFPVGKGQSVNIIAKDLKIQGGLLEKDREYVRAALDLGLSRFMLSFTESMADVEELVDTMHLCSRGAALPEEWELVFKIESRAGVEFAQKASNKTFRKGSHYRLMAARDDLMIQIGVLDMPEALQIIAKKDPRAICASRLLKGLSGEENMVSMADLSDLEYMRYLGFQHFMLSDGISQRHAENALKFWQDYVVFLKR